MLNATKQHIAQERDYIGLCANICCQFCVIFVIFPCRIRLALDVSFVANSIRLRTNLSCTNFLGLQSKPV